MNGEAKRNVLRLQIEDAKGYNFTHDLIVSYLKERDISLSEAALALGLEVDEFTGMLKEREKFRKVYFSALQHACEEVEGKSA